MACYIRNYSIDVIEFYKLQKRLHMHHVSFWFCPALANTSARKKRKRILWDRFGNKFSKKIEAKKGPKSYEFSIEIIMLIIVWNFIYGNVINFRWALHPPIWKKQHSIMMCVAMWHTAHSLSFVMPWLLPHRPSATLEQWLIAFSGRFGTFGLVFFVFVHPLSCSNSSWVTKKNVHIFDQSMKSDINGEPTLFAMCSRVFFNAMAVDRLKFHSFYFPQLKRSIYSHCSGIVLWNFIWKKN
jgi:hypothetical protein